LGRGIAAALFLFVPLNGHEFAAFLDSNDADDILAAPARATSTRRDDGGGAGDRMYRVGAT
jgi:hypothetical protein